MKKTYYIITLLTLLATEMFSQQDPQYTQYMYNMSVVNPAYTNNEVGVINLGALYAHNGKMP